MKVGTMCLHMSQPSVPHSPYPLQALASAISSPSKRRSFDGTLVCRYVHGLGKSGLFGSKPYSSSKSKPQTMKRCCSASASANLDYSFSDEEFSKQIEEIALRFQLSGDDDVKNSNNDTIETNSDITNHVVESQNSFPVSKVEPPDWTEGDEIVSRKANSVDLPLSLRIIKKKKQWEEGFKQVGESAYCSVKKAFSSMVFIIRELQSYTLQMREVLFYEDLQGILLRVQQEMNASFVWLFQQVFSQTPTLMVYVMILLANYSVHSMSINTAMAATLPLQVESVSITEDQDQSSTQQKFDSSTIKTFSISSTTGKDTSIGGNSGGGGKFRVIGSGTDGDGRSDGSLYGTIIPDEVSSIGSGSGQVSKEEEVSVWNLIVEEASEMKAAFKDESLDPETMQRLVSPVTAKIEADDYTDYFRTELMYQTGLVQDPNNVLLLANYAQFLYLVAQDYDRAEEYFKRAVKVEPKDAEALSKYASFLWVAKKDLWAAEETYLDAISVDPNNSYYASNYANFLWNTGGDDTCFPLSSS